MCGNFSKRLTKSKRQQEYRYLWFESLEVSRRKKDSQRQREGTGRRKKDGSKVQRATPHDGGQTSAGAFSVVARVPLMIQQAGERVGKNGETDQLQTTVPAPLGLR